MVKSLIHVRNIIIFAVLATFGLATLDSDPSTTFFTSEHLIFFLVVCVATTIVYLAVLGLAQFVRAKNRR